MSEKELLEIYNKFPAAFRNKLINQEIVFPEKTQFNYSKFLAFRGISREEDDTTPLNREDMRSYYEEGRSPRGTGCDATKPCWYSVSLFREYEDFKNAMKFPRPRKKVAQGYIYCEGGPQLCSETSSHVDWWLYEAVDFSDFSIREDLNG